MSQAAANTGTGFVVAPNIDMNSSIGTMSTASIAGYLAEFYKTPGAYRLPDGRFVLSSFKAENKSAAGGRTSSPSSRSTTASTWPGSA